MIVIRVYGISIKTHVYYKTWKTSFESESCDSSLGKVRKQTENGISSRRTHRHHVPMGCIQIDYSPKSSRGECAHQQKLAFQEGGGQHLGRIKMLLVGRW